MHTSIRFALGGAAIALLGACQHGDPVSVAGGQYGEASIVSGSPKAALPGGSASVTTVFAGFDPTVHDAFSREYTKDPVRGPYWLKSSLFWRYYPGAFRNGDPATLDPRAPTLDPSDLAQSSNGFWDLYAPGVEGDNYWETYAEIDGLKPNTTYTVAFVNYALKQVGELDQTERMLTGTVTQPDSLVIVSGTPGAIALGPGASDWTGAAPAGCSPYPHVNTNPFIVVKDQTDNTGYFWWDKCWTSVNGLGGLSDYTQVAKSMVAPQNDSPFSLPNYNYIEIWRGDYGTGTPVFRMQIGQDQNLVGKPLDNTYPPFPAPNSDSVSLPDSRPFPLADSVLAKLNGAKGAPTGLKLTLSNLQALDKGSAAYVVWYVNPTTGAAKKAVGNYSRTLGGATQSDAATAVSSFKGGPGTITFTTSSTLADMGGSYADSLLDVVVSQEADPSVTTPSASKILWAAVFKLPPVKAGGALNFGNFPGLTYTAQGSATGGVVGDTSVVFRTETVNGQPTQVRVTQFNGSILQMNFTDLQRPPVGYKYELYLVPVVDSATGRTDTTMVDVGGLVGPNGSSLDSAATAPVSSNLTPTGILSASIRVDLHSRTRNGAVDQVCNYNDIRLFLVPLDAATSTPQAKLFDVPMPDRVVKAGSCG